MTAPAALALTCLGLIVWWPLAALTNYIATTWRLGLNERRRRQREATEAKRLDSLIRKGMRELERVKQREREEEMRSVLDRVPLDRAPLDRAPLDRVPCKVLKFRHRNGRPVQFTTDGAA